MRKRGHRERGETTTEKKKKKSEREKKKKNIYGSNPSEFHWLHELLWSCYTPSARPTPLRCLLPTLETMTFIIEGRGEQGRRLGEEHWDKGREDLSQMRGLHILVHQCRNREATAGKH